MLLWQQADPILTAALEIPVNQRHDWITTHCGENEDLSKLVFRLLKSYEASTVGDSADVSSIAGNLANCRKPGSYIELGTGSKIGAYRISHLLAMGGMARVYLAERESKDFEQTVAIKVMSEFSHSELYRQRFFQEQTILARLDHPHIACLYDGGLLEDHRPYYVMEYVEGVDLNEFCLEQDRDIKTCLNVFLQIASAVQYAHRNLVVHRDIKPANILITESLNVKLLDFGIAKLQDGNKSLTKTGMFAYTPEYASPEQVLGDVITTGSDIYQLGLILCKLLTGKKPYDYLDKTPKSIQDTICENEALVPSQLAGLSDSRRHKIKGDLDAIILKMLRKNPQERYGSVEKLIDDLWNYKTGRPVIARVPTRSYFIRKFIYRHRKSFSLSLLVLVLLSASMSYALFQSFQLNQVSTKTELTQKYLLRIIKFINPSTAKRKSIPTASILEFSMELIESELDYENEFKADLLDQIGQAYRFLGDYLRAADAHTKAFEIRRQLYGAVDLRVLDSMRSIARSRHFSGNYDQSERIYRDIIEIRSSNYPDNKEAIAEAIKNLGGLMHSKGDYVAAEALLLEACHAKIALHGKSHPLVAIANRDLGDLYKDWARYDDALVYYEKAWDVLKSYLQAPHYDLALTGDELGHLYLLRGEFEKGRALIERHFEMRNTLYSGEHSTIGLSLSHLADVDSILGNYDSAYAKNVKSLEMFRTYLMPNHAFVVRAEGSVAYSLFKIGKLDQAKEMLIESISNLRNKGIPNHPFAIKLTRNLAEIVASSGACSDAKRWYAESMRIGEIINAPVQQISNEQLLVCVTGQPKEEG